MEILNKNSNIPKGYSLILGFFDGIHAGHQDVISNTISKDKILVTFSKSPTEFFKKTFDYIYPRELSYKIAEKYGVKYIYEQNFSDIVNIPAKDYLEYLIANFEPLSITTGFNYTFGANKQGNPDFIKKYSKGVKYLCTPATKIDNEIVSSTKIKDFLRSGNIINANKMLKNSFILESTVVEGQKLGRELGFPTANMKYPQNIVKIPYGVYKVRVGNKPAIMNWGIKPTIGSEEILEVHIPNYKENLYDKTLQVEIISKIRDEIKFNSILDLKEQIKKDVQECLK